MQACGVENILGVAICCIGNRDQPGEFISITRVIESSIHPLQHHLTEKIGPTHIILVSDSQVYSVRSFHPFSLSDFIPIQKKPTKILVLDIAIALDQPNLHLLVAVCVGLCVPCFSVFSFECLGLGF